MIASLALGLLFVSHMCFQRNPLVQKQNILAMRLLGCFHYWIGLTLALPIAMVAALSHLALHQKLILLGWHCELLEGIRHYCIH